MENLKASLTAVYNYKDRLDIWRKNSSVNKVISNCKKCDKTHCHKSVLLDTGEHICWFCWIRKDSHFGLVVQKPKIKTNKPKPVEAKPKQLSVKTEKITETEVLEDAFSTIDDTINDAGYETEITKLANAVLIQHEQPQQLAAINSAPIIIEEKTMEKEKILPSSTDVKKTEKVAEKQATTQSTKAEKAVAKEVETQAMPEVSYSKYNPYMAQLGIQETKWKRVTWNIIKYGLAALLAIFAIISLYFTSMWQTVNGNGFLLNAGIINADGFKFPEGILIDIPPTATEALKPAIVPEYLSIFSASLAKDLSQLALADLTSSISAGAISSLIAFSIISIAAVFPLLVFKNGTICSATFMGVAFVLLLTVIILFSYGIAAQNAFVTPFRNAINAHSAFRANGDANLIVTARDNLQNLLKALNIPF